MDSSHLHRRPQKIRRTGRHATPSQVEKVAEKAGKAAPAVAIAGALVALPQSAHAEVKTPAKATTVTEQAHTAALVRTTAQPSPHLHGPLGRHAVRDRGEVLRQLGPLDVDLRGEPVQDPQPEQHLRRREADDPEPRADRHRLLLAEARQEPQPTVLTSSAKKLSGNLSCSGLEALWVAAGGRQVGGVHRRRDRHGGIRRQAVRPQPDQRLRLLADQRRPRAAAWPRTTRSGTPRPRSPSPSNGTNWRPWTTYVTGAYRGRC